MPYKDRKKQLQYLRNYSKTHKRKLYSECSEKQKEMHRKRTRKWHDKNPWLSSYYGAKDRCNNPKNKDYKNYGLRDIKFLLTKEQIKFLWYRDKAWNLNQPSIDREDNDGNYELSNCQFIELVENIQKDRIKFKEKYIWIINYIKQYTKGKISILNHDFVNKYIEKFKVLKRANICQDLTKQLREMHKKGILKKDIIGLGIKQKGKPKWINIYML